ncbi:MAG: hypothetical protein M3N39_01885, partial [Pseudomonadota bacterium]|nr:hypothetical protein [Pseudomonadota bacterium]
MQITMLFPVIAMQAPVRISMNLAMLPVHLAMKAAMFAASRVVAVQLPVLPPIIPVELTMLVAVPDILSRSAGHVTIALKAALVTPLVAFAEAAVTLSKAIRADGIVVMTLGTVGAMLDLLMLDALLLALEPLLLARGALFKAAL